MTSLYSDELFKSGTVCTVVSALGIFTQCLGRGIPEDRDVYYLYLNTMYIKMGKQKTVTIILSTDENLRLFRFVKVTVQKLRNGCGKSLQNCAVLVDMHIFSLISSMCL